MMFMAFLWLVALLLLVRWLAGPEAGRLPPERARRAEAELGRLREEVDRLSRQVDRLSDEQGFLLRLLESGERPALPPPPEEPPEEPPDSPERPGPTA